MAVLTAATVVIVGVEQAIILAIVLSIIEHLAHAYRPYDTTLAVDGKGGLAISRVSSGTVIQAAPGLVVYRFGAGLYYANATRFMEEILAIVDDADPKIEWFCLSGAAMGDVDYSGAEAISQVVTQLKERGVTFVLCDVEPEVASIPAKYGFAPEVAAVYPFLQDVIKAYQQRGASA